MTAADTNNRIQRLLPRHFTIVDMAAAGHDNKTIAEVTGASMNTVKGVINSPIGQAEVARLRKGNRESEVLGLDRDATLGKARSILEQASVKAAQTYETLLDCPNPSVALKAADGILDRVFGKGNDDRRGMVINITAEHVDLLNLALKETQNGLSPTHRAVANDSQDGHEDEHRSGSLRISSGHGSTADGALDGPIDVYGESSDGPSDG